MSSASVLAKASRLQKTRGFKLAATVLVSLLAIGGYITFAVLLGAGHISGLDALAQRLDPSVLATPTGKALAGVLGNSNLYLSVGIQCALALGLALAVIWLGVGLAYLALNLVGAGVVAALLLLDGGSSNTAWLIGGMILIAQGFLVGVQALKAAFTMHTPVFAIARNVLTEAVRMKISLVFIVLLIVGLAALPGLLDPEKALRYRVQTFLQWGTGGTFWLLALLTLLFGVSTLTFEQRDKVIWQTVTKPVPAWQYLLGKWLGLVGLNAVLLLVCSGGVFLFTEYLRATPAIGEAQAYVAEGGAPVSEDRLLLETQVLTARDTRLFVYPPELSDTSPAFAEALAARIDAEQRIDPSFGSTAAGRAEIATQMLKEARDGYRAIAPGDYRDYSIQGLLDAKEANRPVTLRYRLDSAGNRPDQFYNITLQFFSAPSLDPQTRSSGLGYFHNVTLSPEYINDQGTIEVRLYNGRLGVSPNGALGIEPNPASITFPEDGLQVTYQVSSYYANYLRVVAVLWIKLALLAMLAVWAGTFLSFPVACLVAFAVFVMAEMSGFFADASDIYGYTDHDRKLVWYKVLSTPVAEAVGSIFSVYRGLDPVRSIVEGEFLPWTDVALGVAALGGMTAVFFFIGVLVFRRRELAMYSGQ